MKHIKAGRALKLVVFGLLDLLWTQHDEPGTFDLRVMGAEVTLRLETPIQIPYNPMLHSTDVCSHSSVYGDTPRWQVLLALDKLVHELLEACADHITGYLQIDTLRLHEHRDDVVATNTPRLLHVVRVDVLQFS